MLSNGELFVRPFVGTGKGWQTKPALGKFHDIAYHPTGRFVAVVGDDGRARFLDSGTGAVKHEFSWKRGPLYSVCFAPDGLTCAVGAGGARVVIWDVDT
jgi:WD40 repeat protein